jgi:hypothetical protein
MEVLVFTPPEKGLVVFNQGGMITYGIYLGTSPGGRFRVFCPQRAAAHQEIDIRDTENYYCQLIDFDYTQLSKMDRGWWKGIIIEAHGGRCEVTDARLSFPTYEWFMVMYRDKAGREREINLRDAALKFVGHKDVQT